MRQIILDTETTGLSPEDGHRIIEIAGVEVENRRLTGKHFHQYINPERDIDVEAQKIHGIAREFLTTQPKFSEIVNELVAFINGAELVIHNAPFDVGFLNYEFKLLQQDIGPLDRYCTVVDTLTLARQLHPGQRNSLDALCKRYDIDNSGRELHGALIDADLLALTYLAMTSGQEALFIEETKSTSIISHEERVVQNKLVTSKNAYKVINADEAELILHQKNIENIAKLSGKNLWISMINEESLQTG